MCKILNCLYLLFILTGISACSAKITGTEISDFKTFPDASNPAENRLLDVGLPTPAIMTIYKDSLLLVVNNLNQNPFHARVFDINTGKPVKNMLPVSRQKGGILSFMSFGITDSLVWVFDVAKNGFIVANIDSALKGDGAIEYYSEYRLKPQVFYYDAILLNRNEAILNCNYDTDEKLVYKNFTDSTQNKQLLSYRQDSSTGSSRVIKMSYENFMMLRPDKQKIALACRYADQLEILDITGENDRKVNGPEGFLPKLIPFESSIGEKVAAPNEKTRYGFLKGHATQKFIYLLFSGYYLNTPHQFSGNKIYVFDWDGHPVKQVNLKNDIIDFSVTSDDKILYTLNPLTKTIGFLKL
ncbi:MAG: hypothetical protein KF746_08195 [Chitinophagaceae bacterium]|nr:hypothetical protein [Chitinophagaceae bacterium]